MSSTDRKICKFSILRILLIATFTGKSTKVLLSKYEKCYISGKDANLLIHE